MNKTLIDTFLDLKKLIAQVPQLPFLGETMCSSTFPWQNLFIYRIDIPVTVEEELPPHIPINTVFYYHRINQQAYEEHLTNNSRTRNRKRHYEGKIYCQVLKTRIGQFGLLHHRQILLERPSLLKTDTYIDDNSTKWFTAYLYNDAVNEDKQARLRLQSQQFNEYNSPDYRILFR